MSDLAIFDIDYEIAKHNPEWLERYKHLHLIHIYILSDDSGVRYVGQTNDPVERLGRHTCDASAGRDKTKRGLWIQDLFSQGIKPVLTVIETCHRDIANERERLWVCYYHQQGAVLLNGIYKFLRTAPVPEGVPEDELPTGAGIVQ